MSAKWGVIFCYSLSVLVLLLWPHVARCSSRLCDYRAMNVPVERNYPTPPHPSTPFSLSAPGAEGLEPRCLRQDPQGRCREAGGRTRRAESQLFLLKGFHFFFLMV